MFGQRFVNIFCSQAASTSSTIVIFHCDCLARNKNEAYQVFFSEKSVTVSLFCTAIQSQDNQECGVGERRADSRGVEEALRERKRKEQQAETHYSQVGG